MNIAECVVILAVALCVFGPKRLPMLMKHTGLVIRWLVRARGHLMQETDVYLKTLQLEDNLKKAEDVDVLYQKKEQSSE